MGTITIHEIAYEVDSLGFLIDGRQWTEEFAESMSASVGIEGSLNDKHLDVIHFIRNTMMEYGNCPLVYQTCKANNLKYRELKQLFPTGYLRGACLLAGLSHTQGLKQSYAQLPDVDFEGHKLQLDKSYSVDVRGYLFDFMQWDTQFAVYKASELKMNTTLTDKHWQIINFLRNYYSKNSTIPTVYETCEANSIEIDELGFLFPDGYHRGAIKIAGLRG